MTYDYDKFFIHAIQSAKPAIHIVQRTSADSFCNLGLRLHLDYPSSVIRTVRGIKSKTVETFFDEVSAALQFPYYFGHNWAAFEECIVDLDWVEGDSYLIMVSDGASLLMDADPDEFRILLRLLNDANSNWLTPNAYHARNRDPTPFNVMLSCETSEEAGALSSKLEYSNVSFGVINIDS